MKQINRIKSLAAVAAAAFSIFALAPMPAAAGTLSTAIIGMFPKDMSEFAYANLKDARQLSWFSEVQQQMLPANFREFEQFLRSAGIDPVMQVDEMAWGAESANAKHPYEIAGVALGTFSPDSTEARFAAQKIPMIQSRGYKLWAFGSGAGPNDIFFMFFDNSTAAFGQRDLLQRLIDVRFGAAESLLNNNQIFPLIQSANGNGTIWAVLDQANTRLALDQLLPQASQFPQAAAILNRIHAMEIHVQTGDGIDAKFEAVCASPDDANQLAAMMQGGIVLRRYQIQQSNPDLAQALGSVTVSPAGDRLNVDAPVTNDQLAGLIRSRTFAFTPAQN